MLSLVDPVPWTDAYNSNPLNTINIALLWLSHAHGVDSSNKARFVFLDKPSFDALAKSEAAKSRVRLCVEDYLGYDFPADEMLKFIILNTCHARSVSVIDGEVETFKSRLALLFDFSVEIQTGCGIVMVSQRVHSG